MTPRALVEHALALLLDHDMAGFAGLWAVDGELEFPFAAADYPARIRGRAAIAGYLRDYPNILDIREIPERTVHETGDPEVVVVEFTAAGVVVATGRDYRLRYIAVITVRDAEIRHYRDYWSPLAAAEIMGGADALTTTFAGGRDA
ncbi:nuclear transport factor 2 family protein [Nocardia crassostreae]|uniref:nuclear transport factor 2 family protein n=1 Tax=Nocardia crassostreae TaxID=53428 RepID=UPI00082A07D6|nr:nuclear transport factor 2 family protein [Nocardia crassostreae]